MTTRLTSLMILSLAVSACAPQAEIVRTKTDINDLRADVKAVKAQMQDVLKRMDGMEQDVLKRLELMETNVKGMVDLQKNLADYGARFDQFTTDLQLVQGKVEENNFRISELAQKIDDKGFKIGELAARMDDLEVKLRSHATGTAPVSEKQAPSKAPEPSEAYRQAMNDYNKGNFDLALAGFQNYIAQFPDASQADKARYWIGECYYSMKEYGKAIEAFTKLLKAHPKSDKAPGARLKIGYSYLNEKNAAKAKEHLNRVIKDYPNSREAELAKEKLGKIGK